ncbi:histidine triad nucleotide-binding protein [Longivirga aurantiaca]|uniref:Histidine triad nucleotide-binding protein n=1 Tax=Longivirga aurantiaca TaxID=1837743 RepID=A0ABW1T4U5_9ACTN
MSDCLFCRIVAGEIPSTVVLETDEVLAFRDIAPAAPTHVVVVPKEHHVDVVALTATDPDLAGRLLAAGAAVAAQEGLGEGFRLVFNTGAHAGQTVFHLHLHVLGGRPMSWPPG